MRRLIESSRRAIHPPIPPSIHPWRVVNFPCKSNLDPGRQRSTLLINKIGNDHNSGSEEDYYCQRRRPSSSSLGIIIMDHMTRGPFFPCLKSQEEQFSSYAVPWPPRVPFRPFDGVKPFVPEWNTKHTVTGESLEEESEDLLD